MGPKQQESSVGSGSKFYSHHLKKQIFLGSRVDVWNMVGLFARQYNLYWEQLKSWENRVIEEFVLTVVWEVPFIVELHSREV